jgi:hypothetical protein
MLFAMSDLVGMMNAFNSFLQANGRTVLEVASRVEELKLALSGLVTKVHEERNSNRTCPTLHYSADALLSLHSFLRAYIHSP